MKSSRRSAAAEGVQHWRDSLSSDDEAEVVKWIRESGFERVGRIISVLADSSGERGRTVRPDSKLLLDMAKLKHRNRSRGNHSIAMEVVRTAQTSALPPTSLKTLAAKLRDDFNETQYAWLWLASHEAESGPERGGHNRPLSPIRTRTLGRLIEMLPEILNAYGALLADAKKLGDDKVELVNICGRKRCEELLTMRIREQMDHPSFKPDRPIPRSFFDLISDDLEIHAAEQRGRK